MDDPREKRKLAADWREYLGELRESFGVYAWAWREFVTPKSRRWMRYAVVVLFVMTALGMVQPLFIKRLIDGLVARSQHAVTTAVCIIAAITVIERLCQWAFESWKELALGQDICRLDVRTSELFFEKSLGQHLQDENVLNAANVEKGRARALEVEHMLAFEGVPTLIELILAFTLLWIISPVGGVVMTLLLAVYCVFMLYLNRRVLVDVTPIDAELRKFNRHRVERWDNIERVKTCGKEKEEVGFMNRWVLGIISRDAKFWLWAHKVNTVRGVCAALAIGGLVAYGAWQVWRGDWTVGFLFPFYVWTRRISDNLWRLGHIEHRLNWNMPSVRALMQALTIPPAVVDRPDAVGLSSCAAPLVAFEHVSHVYVDSGAAAGSRTPHVLTDVSFTIEPGEKVALIGPSGAGKTTVMRLLQRYMDAGRGRITVDGIDMRDIRQDDWRALVGCIAQQAQVLNGTIRYNLLYGLPEKERDDVSDEEIWRVMRLLQIDFGERLTDGLDTVVGRHGIRLSGGQAQRLMIGAAVMKKPRFMIVDEATSSLDSTTEKAVQEGLARLLPADSSALIITHRLSTVRHLCDKFIVLRPAESVEGGKAQVEAVACSFEELCQRSPTFKRLCRDQGIVL